MKRFLYTLIILMTMSCWSQAQDIQAIANRIDEQRYEFPQEKIHVMTDRGRYMTGDTIWLRAWVVDASSHRQVDASKFVYVELVAPDDSVYCRVKIHQGDDGVFDGYLPLDMDLPEGRYQLTAYTMFMQSVGADYFYRQPVDVSAVYSMRRQISSKCVRYKDEIDVTLRYETSADGELSPYDVFGYVPSNKMWRESQYNNRTREVHLTLKGKDANMSALLVRFDNYLKYVPLPAPEVLDVSFYPEGGYLVPGVENAVTFKIHNNGSTALAGTGELTDGNGRVIAPLVVEHDGMGLVEFTPEIGMSYSARWKNDLDEYQTADLPPARPEATVLQVRRNDAGRVGVRAVGAQAGQSLIVLQQRGQMLAAGNGEVDVDEGSLPPGVVQALLLDEGMRCLSERLFFVNSDTLSAVPVVITDSEFYGDRAPVRVSVDLSEITHGGNYAVTVIDGNASEVSEGNICANLLLQSDLQGRVNNPAYYFMADDSIGMRQRRHHLDLLMLTQGWRRYDIPRALRGHLVQPEYPIEVSQVVTGRVLSEWRKKPLAGAKVSMIAPRVEYSDVTITDSLGEFILNLPLMPDSVDCLIISENVKGKKQMNLELDNEPFPATYYLLTDEKRATASRVISDEQAWRMERNGDWRHIILNELMVTGVRPRRAAEENNPYILSPRKMASKGIHSIEAAIREFPGLTIKDGNLYSSTGRPEDRVTIVIDGEKVDEIIHGFPDAIARGKVPQDLALKTKKYMPTILGVKGFDLSEISMAQTLVNFQELAAVKYLKGAHGGYLLFYHKEGHVQGAGSGVEVNHYLKVFQPMGVQQPAEYYTPQYDQGDCGNEPGTDVRTLLYWNPCVTVDDNGQSSFSFYSSDVHNTTYMLTIEGVMPDGSPVRATRQLIKR